MNRSRSPRLTRALLLVASAAMHAGCGDSTGTSETMGSSGVTAGGTLGTSTTSGGSTTGGASESGTSQGSESEGTSTGTSASTSASGTDATTTSSSGDTSSTGSSTTGMAGPVCGNGVVEAGEECDDGDDLDKNACSNACTKVPCDQQEGGGIGDVLSYIWIANSTEGTVSKIDSLIAANSSVYARIQRVG